MLSLVEQAAKHGHKTAIVSKGVEYSYIDLFMAARSFAADLLDGIDDLYEVRVGLMVNPGFEYVQVQWATWLAGGVSVPFNLSHSLSTLTGIIEETKTTIIIVSPEYEALMKDFCKDNNIRLIVMQDLLIFNEAKLPSLDITRRALILFSNDNTDLPKGLVFTHQNIKEQITKRVKEWGWNSEDYTLSILPLHQIEGIINVVSCALFAGAVCEFRPSSVENIFESMLQNKQTVFMATSNIYVDIINYYEKLPSTYQMSLSNCMNEMRLTVNLSASLPVSFIKKWKTMSGHNLIEIEMNEVGLDK